MSEAARPQNFLAQIIEADVSAGRNGGNVVTRFPPEPNGFLHIGHAKSILLNFGLARAYGGRTHLRFDDTNPITEETEYVEAIEGDVRWLGGDWGQHLYYASDFFEKMYECAERLVREGKAYVDTQSQEAIREQRGSFATPGQNSPFRDRDAKESLDLFRRMRAGEFPDGTCVLRARIDMAHKNVLMRDPLLYRIRHAHHHRTGDSWCIYPMYDYAHPLEDAFEGVTHSICTLEFESNRELYDWVLDNLGPWNPRPHQYEFARLALGYTIMSKRKLLQLVNEKHVWGWDDPRMPTIAGMRRRGVTPDSLREFADLIGVAKNNSVVDIGKFEYAVRTDLERRSPRAMAVLNPLKVIIDNWPKEKSEDIEIPWWPAEPARGGTRKVPLGREIFIERDDFSLEPPADFRRLAPGREVRLAGAYLLRCERVTRGPGEIAELHCVHDPASRREAVDRRRASGTIHWVDAHRSLPVEVRLYDRLFRVEQPDAEGDFLSALNPNSLTMVTGARAEPALADAVPGTWYQFLRQGYFYVDPVDSRPGTPVFNRTMSLKDTWAARTASRPEARQPRTRSKERAPNFPAPATGTSTPLEETQGVPTRKKRAEFRAELRAAKPVLENRFRSYQDELGLGEEEADLLSGDEDTCAYYDAALASYLAATAKATGSSTGDGARSIARWLLNELLGLAKSAQLTSLPLDPASFGRFVSLVDGGRIAPAAAKALLASLVERGGDPEIRMRELGLAKTEDRGAIDLAIAAALAAQQAEVDRYRAGETKLFGFLLGAVMKRTQGTADPAWIRQLLREKLGGGERT
ncbi:MAG TPA: glutamine--tRNA ligase/YqeY domain fusion protein [Anaeromyxobacteraceae bacterium]|nr:glutamine--tRNA ligase/YqeY domain fusion protein [Anaeromyxobacteraceae bacterium]